MHITKRNIFQHNAHGKEEEKKEEVFEACFLAWRKQVLRSSKLTVGTRLSVAEPPSSWLRGASVAIE